MQPVVREARTEDKGAIADLLFELFQVQHQGRPDLFRRPTPHDADERARMDDYVAGALADPSAAMFVALLDDDLVGLVHVVLRAGEAAATVPFRHAFRECWIQHIVVAERARSRGVGRALDDAAQRFAAEKRCDSIGLQVWAFSEGAAAFYGRLGYGAKSHHLFRRVSAPVGDDDGPV